MRFGVHCSVRKGFTGALDEAAALRCDTLQMFTQSPRGWKTRVYLDDEFRDFRKQREALGFFPVLVHSPYLPNLCTSDSQLYSQSLRSLKDDLLRCDKLGAEYLVIHPGAYSPSATREEGVTRLAQALNEALSTAPGASRILIENVAGGGRRIGGTFKEMADILNGVEKQNRIGVCFDTCHAFAAGYDISTAEGVRKTLTEFDREIGLDAIHAFHVNDSKTPLGSHRDLHEHIGKGHVGEDGFRHLFRNESFKKCAFILETPKQPPTADEENLRKLRSLVIPAKFLPTSYSGEELLLG